LVSAVTFRTITLADSPAPDANARLTRSALVMTFTREPPMSIASTTGRGFRLLVFFAMDDHNLA
jgi:hypothetical protein